MQNMGEGRAFATPGQHSIYGIIISLKDGLHPAIGKVFDPAC
jgi:hypothetical protein